MKPKVLVVDDSIDMQELVEIHLRQEQVDTIRAVNAEEAIDAARAQMPAAIVLDLELGSTSGLDVCRALKADAQTEPIPIIILTGTPDSPVKLKAFLAGAVDYVLKPFYGGDLRTRVRSAIRLRRFSQLLAEHAGLDADTELYTRATLDRRGPAGLALIAMEDAAKVIETYGVPFYYSAMRALGDVVRTVAPATECFLYSRGVVAVVCPDAACEQQLRAAVSALSLTHAGRAVDLGIKIQRAS
jgi:CheY-like chemotaxis protein